MSVATGTVTISFIRGGVSIPLSQASDSIESFIETKDLDFGEPARHKQILGFILEIQGYADQAFLSLKVGWRNKLSQPLTWGPEILIAPADPIYYRPPASRYYRLHFRDTFVSQTWKINRIQILGRPAGGRL